MILAGGVVVSQRSQLAPHLLLLHSRNRVTGALGAAWQVLGGCLMSNTQKRQGSYRPPVSSLLLCRRTALL